MSCVRPEDGNVFVQPDQSGAEALVVAHEARDGNFRRLFANKIKPHTYMALQIFVQRFRGAHPVDRYLGVDPTTLRGYEEWPSLQNSIQVDHPKEYKLGKKVIHAKNYDMGPRTFQVNVLEESAGQIALTFAEAKHFLATHEASFPEILELQRDIRERAAKDRILRNLFGYPRYFGGLWNNSLLRKMYAFIPQSTVGTITNLCFTDTYYYIEKHNLPWTLLNNKHDSILMEVPDTSEHREHADVVLQRNMGRELTSTSGEKYQMKVGMSWGYNWGHASPGNPEGMKEV